MITARRRPDPVNELYDRGCELVDAGALAAAARPLTARALARTGVPVPSP